MKRTAASPSPNGLHTPPKCRRTPANCVGGVLVLLCLAASGCMHRRMTIRSDPPGALVLLDGKEIGYTPASIDFTYYGTREITLVKEGFETLTVMQKVKTPWYEVFPAEFVTDNLVPVKINDRHDFSYQLRPQVIVPTNELLDRAGQLRKEAEIPQSPVGDACPAISVRQFLSFLPPVFEKGRH
jgi:hypothetical protein